MVTQYGAKRSNCALNYGFAGISISLQHRPGQVHNNTDGLSRLVPKQPNAIPSSSTALEGDKPTYADVVRDAKINWAANPNRSITVDEIHSESVSYPVDCNLNAATTMSPSLNIEQAQTEDSR